ncbi:alpha/beta fold hydrolase [Agromyces sp. NPDC058136]|uniref:alpha/beta fold hydrolase n=1 Tax=Agromyces sp. NPDC058136 TaxID=3346354 RepID=UPI0036DE895C
MQQHIDRPTMADGTELAVATIGAGRPIVYVGGWLSHLALSWELPEERAYLESLAEGGRLVRYDRAGCGLSGPASRPPSMECELEQLDVVVGSLGPEPFDLVGVSMGAPVAVAWAAARPSTVRRLVLYGGWATGAEVSSPAVQAHVLGLIDAHWGLASDVLTDIFAPDAPSASRERFAAYQRASSDAATARALLAMGYRIDVADLLPRVAAPTLVIHRRQDRAAPLAQGEALARGIPDSRLVVLEGRSHLPYEGDSASVVAQVRRFLGLRASRRAARVLTPRQVEVAALVSEGLTNRQVAARLGIDERSAEGHVERILLRLGFRSRAQIAAWFSTRAKG